MKNTNKHYFYSAGILYWLLAFRCIYVGNMSYALASLICGSLCGVIADFDWYKKQYKRICVYFKIKKPEQISYTRKVLVEKYFSDAIFLDETTNIGVTNEELNSIYTFKFARKEFSELDFDAMDIYYKRIKLKVNDKYFLLEASECGSFHSQEDGIKVFTLKLKLKKVC